MHASGLLPFTLWQLHASGLPVCTPTHPVSMLLHSHTGTLRTGLVEVNPGFVVLLPSLAVPGMYRFLRVTPVPCGFPSLAVAGLFGPPSPPPEIILAQVALGFTIRNNLSQEGCHENGDHGYCKRVNGSMGELMGELTLSGWHVGMQHCLKQLQYAMA